MKCIQKSIFLGPTSSLEISARKKILKNNTDISIFFTDVYRGDTPYSYSKYANQNNNYLDYLNSQRVILGFKYKFGKQKIKAKVDKKQTDEQKD